VKVGRVDVIDDVTGVWVLVALWYGASGWCMRMAALLVFTGVVTETLLLAGRCCTCTDVALVLTDATADGARGSAKAPHSGEGPPLACC
jgi:hypothetical protein